MAETTERRAKLFQNGRSQAVRLPKEFRFEGTEVRIRRRGQQVILEPVVADQSGSGLDGAIQAIQKLGTVKSGFAAMVIEEMRKLGGS